MNKEMIDKIDEVFCNKCSRTTKHRILCSTSLNGEVDILSWTNTYQVLECGGCGNVMFRKRFWLSKYQDYDPEAKPVYKDTYFPPPLFREKPKWFENLGETLSAVIEEVYVAIQNNTRYLAAVGARTALDIILVDKVTDRGTFKDKLNTLRNKGLVSEAEKEMLEAVTEKGNAAAHRGFIPAEMDLIAVMDILESILEKLYISEIREKEFLQRARDLKAKVPKRKP